MICKLCNKSFKNKLGLSKHLQQTHKLTFAELKSYYLADEFGIDNLVQCEICKLYFKTIQFHIKIHNISYNQYKEIYGNKTISKMYLEKMTNGVKNYFKNVSINILSSRGQQSANTRKINNSNSGGTSSWFSSY